MAVHGAIVPQGFQVLARSSIPMIWAPSGTGGANGAITLGTALPTTYANCWLNLPANSITASNPAGWYFAQMSSTTLGTVFNNTYTTGSTSAPASTTAFSGTNGAAYTGVTSATTAAQITVPAGTLGVNGIIRITDKWKVSSSANSKTLVLSFSGSNVRQAVINTNGQTGYSSIDTYYNRGLQNAQVGPQFGGVTGGVGVDTGNNDWYSINFAASQTFQTAATLATATEYIVMESFLVEVAQ